MDKEKELKRFALDLARHYYGRAVVKAHDEADAIDRFYDDYYSDKLLTKECFTHLEDEVVHVEEADWEVLKKQPDATALKKQYCVKVERHYTGKLFVDADNEEQAREIVRVYNLYDDADYEHLKDVTVGIVELEEMH